MKFVTFTISFLIAFISFSQNGKITVYGKPGFSGIIESEVIAMSTGLTHSLLLQENGDVITWVDKTDSPDYAPPTNLSNVKDIASGSISAILYKDGTVDTWGFMDSDDIVRARNLTDIIKIESGGFGILALSSTGNITHWGWAYNNQRNIPLGLKHPTDIALGNEHVLALQSDSTVVAWGTDAEATTVPQGLNKVVDIAAGHKTSLALKEDGTIVSWGQSQAPTNLTNVKAIENGMALLENGTLRVWGYSGASTIDGMTGIELIGDRIALKNDGTIITWDDNGSVNTLDFLYGDENNINCFSVENGYISIKEDLTVNSWGDGIPENLPVLTQVASNSNHSLGITESGDLIGWGKNNNGELDIPDDLSNVRAVTVGSTYSLAVDENDQIHAWGIKNGGLSDVPTSDLSEALRVATCNETFLGLKKDSSIFMWGENDNLISSLPSGLNKVIDIAIGVNHAVALLENGSVITWGSNNQGQIELPENTTNIVDVAAGDNHTVILDQDGKISGFGANEIGQISFPDYLKAVEKIDAKGSMTLVLSGNDVVLDMSSFSNESTNLTIYPNPSQNTIYINTKENVKQIQIFNLMGNEVKTFENGIYKQLDISDLDKGTYILKVVGDQNIAKTFVKQ